MLEQTRKHEITTNMLKKRVRQTSETKAGHIDETHEMILFLKKCMLLKRE